jgi:hypothetical protein
VNVEDLPAPVALGVAMLLLVLTVGILVTVRRGHRGTERALADARAEAAELRARLDALSQRVDAPVRPTQEFVITDIGSPDAEPLASPPTRIEGRLFADIVLRESLVKAASLGYGVRRALAPETRNRIRFEMKREMKRSRRQRRTEHKEMRRRHQAHQREQEVA